MIEWLWVFYSSDAGRTVGDVLRLLISPRAGVCPCTSTARTKDDAILQDAESWCDDVSTHPLGNQVETGDERGWQSRNGKRLKIYWVRESWMIKRKTRIEDEANSRMGDLLDVVFLSEKTPSEIGHCRKKLNWRCGHGRILCHEGGTPSEVMHWRWNFRKICNGTLATRGPWGENDWICAARTTLGDYICSPRHSSWDESKNRI